jgi:polar amino acid transport system substrate-binding protein
MRGLTVFIALVIVAVCAIAGCTEQPGGAAQNTTVLLYTEEFAPFNSLGPNGTVTGSSTEVVREILDRLGEKGTIELLPWSEGYRRTLETPGAAQFSTARTPEREALFLWVGPIGSNDMVFFARNGSGIRIDSLGAATKAGTIGVVKDDARHQYLQANNITNVATFRNDEAAAKALMNGSIALWFGGSKTAPYSLAKAGYSASDVEQLYLVKTLDLYISFNNRTDPGRVAAWQKSLDDMKKDGTYDAIMARHFGKAVPSAT